MGHYDSCYESSENDRIKKIKDANKKAEALIEKAIQTAIPDNKTMFLANAKQAIFWLSKA